MIAAKDFLKRYTTVPNTFIDDFLEMYHENTGPNDLVIDLQVVSVWLNVKKFALIKTLKLSYKQGFDYTIGKGSNPKKKDPRNNNYKQVLITPDCFKRLCMQSRSKMADQVRSYFIEVENVLIKYRQDLVDGMQQRIKHLENNQKSKAQAPLSGFIYVFKASNEQDSVYKLGRANTWKRIKDHESSRADDLEVLFTYETSDLKTVESCAKLVLKSKQYRKYKEIYQADLNVIKQVIDGCAKVNNILKMTYRRRKPLSMKGGLYMAIHKSE